MRLGNRTIHVNLDISRYFVVSLQIPPLWGFVSLWFVFLHRCRPYGTKERFCGIQDLCLRSGAVRMQHLGEYTAKPNHTCQFSDFSRYFVGAPPQMPPLWGLGFWLLNVSTQMPSLWDSRGFLGIHSLCLRILMRLDLCNNRRVFGYTQFVSQTRFG